MSGGWAGGTDGVSGEDWRTALRVLDRLIDMGSAADGLKPGFLATRSYLEDVVASLPPNTHDEASEMTVDDVWVRIKEIETVFLSQPLEPEHVVQHRLEDELWMSVLEAISAGAPLPQALARNALKTRMMQFERECR